MPAHSEDKKMKQEKPMKEEKPKKKTGMRKLSDKEKALVKEHFEKHEPDADAKRKAQVRMKLMRSKEVKSMKGLHSAVGK